MIPNVSYPPPFKLYVLRTACNRNIHTGKEAKKSLKITKGTESLGSEEVAAQELGATPGLCRDHVTTNALRTRSHRNPRHGELCCTRADLSSIRVANGLPGSGARACRGAR